MTVKENNTLILFTRGYPYSAVSESFLDPEIPYLSSVFEKIIIVPTKITSSIETTRRKLPSNVIVDNSYLQNIPANKYRNKLLIKMFRLQNLIKSRYFYCEVIKNIPAFFHPLGRKCILRHLSSAIQIEKWLKKYIRDNNLDLSKTIFYTYWLIGATTGVAFVKKQYPEIKLISRAHGWDLYLERHNPPFIPFRPKIFHYLNRVYLVSKDGLNYLSTKYPDFTNKFEVALLGVKDPGFITKISYDNIYHVVSCSSLVPVKRIELLIRGLKELGEMKNNCQFNWVHIGGGPLKKDLEDLASRILPKNVNYIFLGFITNDDVINYYKNNPVDILINVSKSEGGNPVSIMEAQSCGIPVIATAVGGNKEIVSIEVGILLSSNPNPHEISEALINFLENQELANVKKYNSILNWKNNYSAERNFSAFAQQLKEI